MRGRILFSIASLLVSLGAASTGMAASSSWIVEDQARTRLVAARDTVSPQAAAVKLGWQVRLAPGWKTYWRNPGDAGLPPRFDWSGSRNLAAVDVAWPTPERLTVFGYDTVVYEDEVVLPITVKLTEPGAAADLNLKVEYMVCENICVPLEARYRITLPAGDGAGSEGAALIARFEGRVPVRQPALGHGVDGRPMWLESAAFSGEAGQLYLDILVHAAGMSAPLDAFVDGPDMVAFGRATVVDHPAADIQRLRIPVYGARAEDLSGRDLAIVMVTDDGDAVEWRGRVSD